MNCELTSDNEAKYFKVEDNLETEEMEFLSLTQEESFDQQTSEKGGENMSEQEVDLQQGPPQSPEVPFCCVQVVPGNLEVKDIAPGDIDITFTPKLECCIQEQLIGCTTNGVELQIEGKVLKLVGCIEYALSTNTNPQNRPIQGDITRAQEAAGALGVEAGCKSCVCVDEIICFSDDSALECPETLNFDEIMVEFGMPVIEECPEGVVEPDKKIIKFTGKFILPETIIGCCPPTP